MDVRPVYSLSRLTDRSLLNLTKFLELELHDLHELDCSSCVYLFQGFLKQQGYVKLT